LVIYLFAGSLFNDMVSNSFCIAAKNKKVTDEWIMNDMQGSAVF